MADQALNILHAIHDRLLDHTADGFVLEQIRQFYVRRTDEEDFPTEFAFPFLYVYADAGSGEEASIPACMTRKQLPVTFQVFTGQGSGQHDLSAARLIDLIEDTFFQQQLGISNLLIHYAGKNYDTPIDVPFSEWVQAAAGLTYIYEYTDARSMPT